MDITNPKILKLKGALFLLLGVMSGGILISILPDWKVLLLLGICVWAFSRFYYFAFYVLHDLRASFDTDAGRIDTQRNPKKQEVQNVVTHQPAISFSNSFRFPFNRAGGRISNVRQETS